MNQLSFNGQTIDYFSRDNNTYYSVGDIAKILQYCNTSGMVRGIRRIKRCDIISVSIPTIGGDQQALFIDKHDLLLVLSKSRKYNAVKLALLLGAGLIIAGSPESNLIKVI
jgi:prophage antirepressor-like protein